MAMHLPIGYKLQFKDRPGVYTILKVFGRGASTIAYLASYDAGNGRTSDRIIKEFCPQNLPIERNEFGALLVDANQQGKFDYALKLFVAGGDRQNELRNKTYLRNETPPLLEIFSPEQNAKRRCTARLFRIYKCVLSLKNIESNQPFWYN